MLSKDLFLEMFFFGMQVYFCDLLGFFLGSLFEKLIVFMHA